MKLKTNFSHLAYSCALVLFGSIQFAHAAPLRLISQMKSALHLQQMHGLKLTLKHLKIILKGQINYLMAKHNFV